MTCACLIQTEIQTERPEHPMTRAKIDAVQPVLLSQDAPASMAFLRDHG